MKCTKTDTVKTNFRVLCSRQHLFLQEKPSAAASGGTAHRSTKHCLCSNDSKRFTRCAHLHLLSAQRIYSAHRYTVRSAAQRAVLHSAPRYTAPSASLRPALHCAKRCTVRSIVHPPPSSASHRAALYSAQYYTAPSTASQDKADLSNRTKHTQRAALHSNQRYTAPHSAQRFTAPSATLRPAK